MPQEKAFPVHNTWKYVFKKERDTLRESFTTRKILVEESLRKFYRFRVKVQIVKSYDRTTHFMRNGNITNECNTKIF